MAKINTQKLKITVSELLSDRDETKPILLDDSIKVLKEVIEGIIGTNKLVEIELE